MKTLPKLILFDIDGTLVNSDWEMMPFTKNALIQLHENGILLGIASGRPVDDIEFYIHKWQLPFEFDVLIGLNGSELKNNVNHTYSLSHELDPDLLKQAIETMDAQFACIPFIYRDGKILAARINDVIRSSAAKSGKEPIQVPLSELYAKPVVKAMFRTKDGQTIQAMEAYIEANPIEGTKWFKTQETLMEVAMPGISKASPLGQLAQDLGLSIEQIMACGDTTNDNEILKEAGIGICLCNGTEDTKACADEITEIDNDHDGLMKHLIRYYPALFQQTERENPRSAHLDQMSVMEIIMLMNEEDQKCIQAVHAAFPQIEKVIEQTIRSLKKGGRLIYVGAGTSGRLADLDAFECPVTFNSEQVLAFVAQEIDPNHDGEDDQVKIKNELKEIGLNEKDIVIGVAASGKTPYVVAALVYAQEVGASVGAIVCNPYSLIASLCPYTIELNCGPEVLSGSSRLKAGTATKMVLNMISTASMAKLGKVVQNYMVDMRISNQKLFERGAYMLSQILPCSYEEAVEWLKEKKSVKEVLDQIDQTR